MTSEQIFCENIAKELEKKRKIDFLRTPQFLRNFVKRSSNTKICRLVESF